MNATRGSLRSDSPSPKLQPAGPILRDGETCWRRANADRLAFLIDGEAFFGAVADAVENACHSIWLLGWDFHSEVELRRDTSSERPTQLVPLLETIVRERRDLRVRVLAWDFAMLYAMEREFLPLLQFGKRTHRRIHFAMDGTHPLSASQHQKLVVVDDSVAFVGGFDLTAYRWDTRQHAPNDPRRTTPAGKPYQPFHDVQIAVGGDAAAALATLAEERWQRATGTKLKSATNTNDAWPKHLVPDARDVEIGISRTHPRYGEYSEIREVEAVYRESIRAARRDIYIENQYLTASSVGEWLAQRLREPNGPEVVIVGPEKNSGWLEENTMGALRDRVVRMLRDADEHERLRVLYPFVPGLPAGEIVNVHSKVMVIDDSICHVGSSNLSNRSFGLDSECDIVFEANGRMDIEQAIAGFRSDLLSEHLGIKPLDVEHEFQRTGSLVSTIDALRGEERSLRLLELDSTTWAADAIESMGAVDPEHPVPLEELVAQFTEGGSPQPKVWRRGIGVVLGALLLIGFALAWKFTPLAEWVTPHALATPFDWMRTTWYGPAAAFALFVVASLLMVPVTALTAAAGLALGPVWGFPVAWLGSTTSAAIGHGLGRILWRDAIRRIAGKRLNTLSRRLSRRGVLSSIVVRVVPIAPFTVVNLVAGASHVRLRDFVIGTALGILPGTVLLVVASDQLAALIRDPAGVSGVWILIAVLALIGSVTAARQLARDPDEPESR